MSAADRARRPPHRSPERASHSIRYRPDRAGWPRCNSDRRPLLLGAAAPPTPRRGLLACVGVTRLPSPSKMRPQSRLGASAPTERARACRLAAKPLLHDLSKLGIDDGFVLAGIGIALASHLAAVKSVLQHEIESAAGYRRTTGSRATFADDTSPGELGRQPPHRSQLGVEPATVQPSSSKSCFKRRPGCVGLFIRIGVTDSAARAGSRPTHFVAGAARRTGCARSGCRAGQASASGSWPASQSPPPASRSRWWR